MHAGTGHRCLASAATPADGVERLMTKAMRWDEKTRRADERSSRTKPAGPGGDGVTVYKEIEVGPCEG